MFKWSTRFYVETQGITGNSKENSRKHRHRMDEFQCFT